MFANRLNKTQQIHIKIYNRIWTKLMEIERNIIKGRTLIR